MDNYLESDLRLIKLSCALLACLLLTPVNSMSQEVDAAIWNGNWIGEGTLFEIRVEVANGILQVHQVESMGFIWTSNDGIIDGNIVRVEVQYAGATGIIQAELVDNETAVAFAASCIPDFMVVCALAKDRQAVFKKVSAN